MTRDELVSVIEQAAAAHNVPASALLAIANLESSGNVTAKNPRSSASGVFQFVDDTAKEYGLTGSKRDDPTAQAYAAAKMMSTNMRSLERTLGREPSAGELYLAHQQGLGGATALLRNPGRPAVEVLTEVYKGNRTKAESAVRLNGGSASMSAGDFAGKWVSRAEREVSRIPPASIPNTVGSQLDVAPRAAQGMPTPASERPLPRNPPLPQPRPIMGSDPGGGTTQRVAEIPTVQQPQRLPPIVPGGVSYAGQERGPVMAPRQPSATPTKAQVEAATGFRLPGVTPVASMTREEQRADNGQTRPAVTPRAVPGPSAPPKTQDRLDTGQAGITPVSGTAQPNKQQVEAGTGFRLPTPQTNVTMPTPATQRPSSPLVKDVEVENPAYAALLKRIQQGEIEMRGISPSGMAMSRDARARYDASKKALEEAQARLAQTQRTITVQQPVRQSVAPLKVVVQGGNNSGGGGGGAAPSFTGTSSGKTYVAGQQYQMGGDTYTANANGGFTNDRTGRTQGTGSVYYDAENNIFRTR